MNFLYAGISSQYDETSPMPPCLHTHLNPIIFHCKNKASLDLPTAAPFIPHLHTLHPGTTTLHRWTKQPPPWGRIPLTQEPSTLYAPGPAPAL